MLLLLLACDPFPELGDSNAWSIAPSLSSADCSPDVYVPVGLLADVQVPADAHTEFYGRDPKPFAVHMGLPSRDVAKSRSFLWRTDVSTLASSIQIGETPTFPADAVTYTGGSFLYGGSEVGTGDYREHEVRICGGLRPGTQYSYRVGGAMEVNGWSDVYSFVTPREAGTFDSYRLAFFGDSRSDPETWGQVLAAIDAHAPDFMIASGDMVDSGSSQASWDEWFSQAGDVLARRPVALAHGNHEYLAQSYFAQVGLPANEEWYAVDFGDMLLTVLNDTVRDDEEISTEQVQFLRGEFATTSATWRIASHHQPLYSTCSGHGSNEELREIWGPEFDAGNLDIDLAGHNHTYERSVPITSDAEAPDGVTYLVSGGAGAPLYEDADADWFGEVSKPVNHYVIADVSDGTMNAVAYDLSGNVIDQFTLTK